MNDRLTAWVAGWLAGWLVAWLTDSLIVGRWCRVC